MKKTIAILLAALLTICVSACNSTSDTVSDTPAAHQVTAEVQSPETTEAESSVAAEEEQEEITAEAYDFEVLANEVIIEEDSVTFTDARGEQVTLAKNPQRVVSLVNSYTDLWYEAGGTVIGRLDSETELPEEALDPSIQTVGGITSVNMEVLLSLEPDLVIMRYDKQSDLFPQLEENNVPFVAMEYDSFDDYLKFLKVFSALNDKEELYEEKGAALITEIQETINSVPKDNNPTVLLMFGTSKSVKAYLSNTSNGQMLSQLGAINIANAWEDTTATSIELNIEYLISNDPDFILVQCMGETEDVRTYIEDTYTGEDWWQSLSAVQNSRVIYLDRSLFHYKPNADYALAYKEMAEIIYPENE